MERNPDAAKKLGLRVQEDGSYKLDGQSMLASVGGVWGILESAVPGVVYAVAFAITTDVLLSVIVASAVALGFLISQIIRKKPATQAIVGFAGIAIAAILPLRDGANPDNARDYYLGGFITNISYFAALTISVLVRWPLLGVLIGLFTNGSKWRKDKALFRRYNLVTGIWIGLFGVRLLVQVPLYLANEVAILGFVKVFMGVPLYALCAWFTWLAIRSSIRSAD